MKRTHNASAQAVGKLSMVALAIITSGVALADESGWYAGANAGPSTAKIDDARIISGLTDSGATSVTVADSDRDTSYKIYGGYRFNKNFAIEGGAFDLGNFGFRASILPLGALTGNIHLRGLNLDLVGTLPLTDRLSVFGRMGANYAQTRDSFSGTGAVAVLNPNPSEHDTNPKVGLGLQFAFDDSLALRAEVERYRVNDAVGNKGDIDVVSVGLVYRFGVKKPAPVAQTPAPYYPAVVAAAPPPVEITPVPVPVPVYAPPVPRKVSISADSLFGFDKAAVSPTGKQHLDKFAAELQGISYDVIEVTGHTDRIGARAYNQKLSMLRAQAVGTYLTDTAGIPAAKIVAKGVNSSDPATQPGDCVGKAATAELIACLQPDRRVDIQVTGAR
jgi:OOP family OmpA-OmpF porin